MILVLGCAIRFFTSRTTLVVIAAVGWMWLYQSRSSVPEKVEVSAPAEGSQYYQDVLRYGEAVHGDDIRLLKRFYGSPEVAPGELSPEETTAGIIDFLHTVEVLSGQPVLPR